MIESWRKKMIEEQSTKLLKYNLAIGNIDKETERFIIKLLKKRGVK